MNLREIREFTDQLREWGLGGGYTLTPPVDAPVVTRWKATVIK